MNLKEELKKYGFATVDYPPKITGVVGDMMESWKVFCALPLEIKSRFIYTDDDKARLDGTGYEFKDEVGATKDRKENFHFTIRDLARLAEISNEIGFDPQFVNKAGLLLAGIRDPLCEFAQSLEQQFGLTGVRDEVNASWDTWFLRLLHYPAGAKVGEVIAAHHVDKLGLTMYLEETTSGVQYYNQNREWVDMPILPGKTIITPNMQVQYKTQGELKALYHRVIATEESAKNGRYSMVCFADFLQTPQYDKAKHGRLQDMPLAFNYDLPHVEFKKFFRD